MTSQPSFIEIQKYLSGMDYPANRNQLIEHAKKNGADNRIMQAMRRLPDREYDGPNAVSREITKVA